MKRLKAFIGLMALPVMLWAQFSVSGTIANADGTTLPGANVILKNTYTGTTSDRNGRFEINNMKEGEYTIIVSFIGNKTKEQQVNVGPELAPLEFKMERSALMTGEVVVTGVRANHNTPMAFNDLSREDIEENNLGLDLPYLLEQTPSLVVTSDGGTGIGYTGLRIRGTDPTRINVTLNGIPLNDAESHGVFWVNMPDFASSTENIQIQRGVGTSTNGAGAFGGTINLLTTVLEADPYFELNNTIGSFNTVKNTARFGTGLLKNHWSLDGRLSRVVSDGFIDRATSDLNSYFISGAYTGKSSSLRLNIFSGTEETYQAWDGVPSDSLTTNRTFNGTGTDGGQLNPAYDQEVDHYTQTHYQLLGSKQLNHQWTGNIGLHLTKGAGYFEQYKVAQGLADYGLNNIPFGDTTVSLSDLVRRRWLDNDFYGATFSLAYDNNERWQIVFGGAANRYEGQHFGEVIWAQYSSNGSIRHLYYSNDAEKTDLSFYGKANYQLLDQLNLFADLQYRSVGYDFLGNDADGNPVRQSDDLGFFNPKFGLTYNINNASQAYASFGVGNKEPNRNDYTESSPESRPEHETLSDLEVGYSIKGQKSALDLNFYRMDYKNQLVLTGELNDVGAATRVNIPESYRMGVEVQWGMQLLPALNWDANFTLSQNKIPSFTQYIDNWDSWGQEIVAYSDVDLLLSPNVIAGSQFSFKLLEKKSEKNQQLLQLSLLSKYVGQQYIDNTQSEERSLDAYLVNDLRLSYKITGLVGKELRVNFLVRNVLDEAYESNAWVYRYISGGENLDLNGYYPQAGRNFLLGLDLKF